MKKTIIFNLIILIAFTIGILTGSYGTSFFSNNSVNLQTTLDLLPIVYTLKKLRENRVSDSIELLETKLDDMLFSLKDYGKSSRNGQDWMITRSIKLTKAYRSQYIRCLLILS
jgi:hypothetical protein